MNASPQTTPVMTPREFVSELLCQVAEEAAARVAVIKDRRIDELLDANNREVEHRRAGFAAAQGIAAYLENLLSWLEARGFTTDAASLLIDPRRRHPLKAFEIEHTRALIAYARNPYGVSPFAEGRGEENGRC